MPENWKHCSICNTTLDFGQPYYSCSVSTCNRKRTALYFCSLTCFEAHLPMMRHREAWAEEQQAPTRTEWEQQQAAESSAAAVTSAPEFSSATTDERPADQQRRRVVPLSPPASADQDPAPLDDLPRDVLVVVSKLKKYIKARSGMNTSESVVDVLSEHLRRLCTEAIRNAARDGRKTVMDRDFLPLT